MLALASGLVAGALGLIATARKLKGFRDGIEPEIGALLDVFVAIDSETDAFPIGEVRHLWNTEALARLDGEIIVVEQRWRNQAISAATQLAHLLEQSS